MGVGVFIQSFGSIASALLAIFAAMTALEIMLPRSAMTVKERASGFRYWPFFVALQVILIFAVAALISALGLKPLVTFHYDYGSGMIAAVIAAVAGDFMFYWYHRIQHRFFWRFHAVHHSIRNLSAINSYHHWTEPLFTAFIIGIPLVLLDVRATPQNAVVLWIFNAWPTYIHTPTRLHVGPLQRLLIDNRFHRIHHSVEPQHFNHNFGAITPLWDWLFGTAYWPERNEWPAVGLHNLDEPRSLREWSMAPFRFSNRDGPKPPYNGLGG